MQAYVLAGAAGLITLGGGLVALRAEAHRGLVFAFCAGALIATALVGLVPDSLELLGESTQPFGVGALLFACLIGFFSFYLLENLEHHATVADDGVLHYRHGHSTGIWGAAGIGIHSFLDGVALGAGFDAGDRLGWSVALAVLLHKLADGVSVTGVMRGTRHAARPTLAMVVFASLAPFAGVIAHRILELPIASLALVFGWFAGVFLYLGATSLLPAAHEAERSRRVPVAALAGVALVCTAHWLGV